MSLQKMTRYRFEEIAPAADFFHLFLSAVAVQPLGSVLTDLGLLTDLFGQMGPFYVRFSSKRSPFWQN